MESIASAPPGTTHPASPPVRSDAPDAASVGRVLDEVLASPPFCHTLQCQNLLRYIVKHSLAQEEHLLRERVIGAEVFGRKPDYETGEDPIVRIRVAEVRKRLAQFYQSAADARPGPDVQIEIPSGSYRAAFRWRDTPRTQREPEPEVEPAVLEPRSTLAALETAVASVPALPPKVDIAASSGRRPRALWWLIAALFIAAVGFAVYALAGSSQKRAFHAFWQPWTGSTKPVIIAIGSNAVYRLSYDLTDRYAAEHNLETEGMEFFVPIDPDKTITGKDIQPAPNSFVALGDVAAVSAIVATLTAQDQPFQERFPNDISFAELHNSPTVLVGGFNNPMTIEMTRHLPFVLRARNEIDDTRSGRRWMLHASLDSHDTEDYAIITRLPQRNGDAPMLSVAGMGQYGTLAASGFVCNPAAIAQMVHSLPKGWEHQNLQLILHVRVVDFKPVSSDVVAVQSW